MSYQLESSLDEIIEIGFKRIDDAVEAVIEKYAPSHVGLHSYRRDLCWLEALEYGERVAGIHFAPDSPDFESFARSQAQKVFAAICKPYL